jgi:hypothetical protein
MNETTQNSSAASGVLLAGAVVAGATLFATAKTAKAVSPALTFDDAIFGTGDVKVLNYALALEALEADLYAQALQRLTTGGTNALGKTIVGLRLPSSNAAVRYLADFGKIEAAHRNFFQAALGANAITATGKPLATAKFDFDFDDTSKATLRYVLDLVQTAEKTGVGAYLGAIPFFATTTYLQTAAAIQGTEARHTAVITAIINKQFGTTQPVAPLANDNNGIDKAIVPRDVLVTVSPFIVL